MNCWDILDIKPTNDRNLIKNAYMEKLNIYHPEDDPEGFQRLREAYETALKEEISVDTDDDKDDKNNSNQGSIDVFIEKVKCIYNSFFDRINENNWIELLKEDVCFQIDTSKEVGNRLLKFFMDHYYFPTSIWVKLDEYFEWSNSYEDLIKSFPKGFINYVFANINGRFNLRYDLFRYENCVDYDSFIKNYYDAEYFISTTNLYETNKCIERALAIIDYHEDILILKGRYLLKIDRVDEAIDIFNTILQKSDKKATIYYLKAGAFTRQGKIEQAYWDYKKSLKLDQNSLAALKGLSDCAIGLEYYNEARDGYLKLCGAYSYNNELQEILRSINNYLIDELIEKGEVNLKLAQCYSQIGEYEKSYGIAKELELKDKDNKEIILFLAHNLYYLNRLEESYDYFNILVKSDRAEGEVYGGFATVCHDLLNRDEEAIFYYNMAIEYNYALDVMYNNKASLLCRMEVFDEALLVCEESLRINPGMAHAYKNKGEILYNLGRYEEALKASNRAIDIYPDLYEPYVNKAVIYNKLNKYMLALNVCNDAMDFGIKHPRLLCEKGRALYNLNKYDESLAVYQEALDSDSNNKDLHVGIAHNLYVKKEYAEAIKYYTKGIEFDLKNGYLFYIRGKAYKFNKEYDNAINDFNKALELNPDKGEVIYSILGDVYFEKKQYEVAIKNYNESLKLIGDRYIEEDGYIFFSRGRAYKFIGQFEKAISDLNKAVEIAPKQAESVYAYLVDIYNEQGFYDKAVEYCDRVIVFDDKYAPYFYRKGEVLCKLNRNIDAITCFDRAIELNSNTPIYFLQRGLALKKCGKGKAAKMDFKRVLQIEPKNETAKKELGGNRQIWVWILISTLILKMIINFIN